MPPPATETKTTMFDLSWSHLGIFALAAIVLVPTKDLPALLRNIGRYMGDAKKMARDFRSQVDDALKDAELADIKKTFDAEVKGIATSASMADTERSFNASMNSAMDKASEPAKPSGQIIPSVGTALPIEVAADAPAINGAVAVQAEPMATPGPPMPGVNGRHANSDGIDVVSAGRGSVAQRAAAAWKKTAGHESGA